MESTKWNNFFRVAKSSNLIRLSHFSSSKSEKDIFLWLHSIRTFFSRRETTALRELAVLFVVLLFLVSCILLTGLSAKLLLYVLEIYELLHYVVSRNSGYFPDFRVILDVRDLILTFRVICCPTVLTAFVHMINYW